MECEGHNLSTKSVLIVYLMSVDGGRPVQFTTIVFAEQQASLPTRSKNTSTKTNPSHMTVGIMAKFAKNAELPL